MKSKIILSIIAGVLTLFCSCTKETQDEMKEQQAINIEATYEQALPSDIDARIDFYYNEMINKHGGKSIFRKIWKWLVAHSGVTMFGDCGINLSCGQCPGLCANASKDDSFAVVDKDFLMSEEDYIEGKRLFEAALFNDTIMAITFKMSDLVYNDTLFIFEDIYLGSQVSSSFEKSEIVIKAGSYPVSYSRSYNGTTLVDVFAN